MNSLVDSDIQRLVACLVLGYLDNQRLEGPYKLFCESSRHLTKERKGLKDGNTPVDTSLGLVNIIREYYLIKNRIKDVLSLSPLSPIIIQLIDADDTIHRLDIILKSFKESLNQTDPVPPVESSKKRKHEIEDVFNVSQTNTSTPEAENPNKRPRMSRRKSITTPFLTMSANKEVRNTSIDKASTSRAELKYSSSSDTSEKEDEDEEDVEDLSVSPESPESPVLTAKSELQLSETLLNKPEFAEQFADMINKTLLAREVEPTTSDIGQEIVITNDDIDNILSGTQKEMSFEEIVKDLVKDLYPLANQDIVRLELPEPSDQLATSVTTGLEMGEEIPIKQRLRPRNEKKLPTSERKKKFTIISNEPYTGLVPAAANLPRFSSLNCGIAQNGGNPPLVLNLPMFSQTGLEMIPVIASTSSSSSFITSAPFESLTTFASGNIFQSIVPPEPPAALVTATTSSTSEAEKKQTTPKITLYPNFLNSKCKSTPRRKATHVRILDFTQTPSHQRLESVKEFTTPTNGIPSATPGSAPATIGLFKSALKEVACTNIVKVQPVPEADDHSNSNSISNTPKVAKNPRRRKIADSKIEEKKKKKKQKPGRKSVEKEVDKLCSVDDWNEMRMKSKTMSIDQQVRLVYEKADTTDNTKKRRKAKKALTTKQLAVKNKLSSKSPVELKGKMKSPPKKTGKSPKKKEKSSSDEIDENKPLSSIKLRISSPRKVAAAAAQKRSSKHKMSTMQSSKEKFLQDCKDKQKKKKEKKTKEEEKAKAEPEPVATSELNRSDTVQEVATVLTQLSDTILAEKSVVEIVEAAEVESEDKIQVEGENKSQVDSGIDQNLLLETPFKDLQGGLIDETPFKNQTLTPLPNTPRFAIPLLSSTQETPMPKVFANSNALVSSLKNCDILTPSFPITPGLKETPLKDGLDGSPGSGYSSRRTDYSSCSSYYKPDESEDIAFNINAIINQRKSDRSDINSQSESDGGMAQIPDSRLAVLGNVKKVDCPGAIERVKSFTEEQKELPTPHYKMMEDGLLSESMITTATDDSSSSSTSASSPSSCSSCAARRNDDSDDGSTMDKLLKHEKDVTDEKDSEWDGEGHWDKEVSDVAQTVMNEKTGEVRFPLRNWITPKKVEVSQEQSKIDETNRIKSMLNENDPRRGISVQEEHEKRMRHMEEVKQRTLQKIRSETGTARVKLPEVKFKKTNVKSFKLPALDVSKPSTTSRKEQILQQNLTERPRPTPLKLIPSSSTRRKNPTPRKTITINELPRQPSPKKKKKVETPKKSPIKSSSDRLSLESVNDNAIMPEDSSIGLEMSSSFNTSNEEGTASTVITNKPAEKPPAVMEEGSNTFQRSMIAQGFGKNEAKELQSELVDKLEIPTTATVTEGSVADTKAVTKEETDEDSSDESDDNLEIFSVAAHEKNTFSFVEPDNFKPCVPSSKPIYIPTMTLKYTDMTCYLRSSGIIEVSSIEPSAELIKPKKSPKKPPAVDEKRGNGKDSFNKNDMSKSTKKTNFRWDQSKTFQADQGSAIQEQEKLKVKINIKEKAPSVAASSSSTTTFDISSILDQLHGK